mgnify:CR=1 FL=1
MQQEHKDGNDQADEAAGLGVQQHEEGAVELMRWMSKRKKGYLRLMQEVNKVIARVTEAYHKQRHPA